MNFISRLIGILHRIITLSCSKIRCSTQLACFIIVVVAAIAFPAIASAQQVLRVSENGQVNGDGLSWNTAYRFLQDALAEAAADPQNDYEIWVREGTYRTDQSNAHTHCDENEPPGWPDCCPPWGDCGWSTGSFELLDNVGIFGGFLGTETTRAERRPLENITILTGPANRIVESFTNDNTARLDGFHITGGFLVDGFPVGGGGITVSSRSNPVISNCTFTKTVGSAAHIDHSSDPQFINCVFKHNVSTILQSN